MVRNLLVLLSLATAILLAPNRSRAITMSWSPVGNLGNPATYIPIGGIGVVGQVNYSYDIGTYDVTASQYVAFLNANDPTGADPLGIYNSNMSDPTFGEVTFNSGAPRGQMYSVVSGTGNHPISFVNWFDALRFANWIANGQPVFATEPTAANNATENGSYTLLGFTPLPSGAPWVRNPGATVVLPNENEWFKAAFYNPATSSYYDYATSSNTAPTASAPTATPNSANYDGAVGNLTDIGAYTGTTSPYGAYDMDGDIEEWLETLDGNMADLRGGDFGVNPGLSAGSQWTEPISIGYGVEGFRLALVPEPSSVLLALVGCGAAFALRKRLN
jgi:sulfatase modifying factor 1